jgi:hypothetical protein
VDRETATTRSPGETSSVTTAGPSGPVAPQTTASSSKAPSDARLRAGTHPAGRALPRRRKRSGLDDLADPAVGSTAALGREHSDQLRIAFVARGLEQCLQDRRGVSLVADVSRSMPKAVRISATVPSNRIQSSGLSCLGMTCSQSLISSGSPTFSGAMLPSRAGLDHTRASLFGSSLSTS